MEDNNEINQEQVSALKYLRERAELTQAELAKRLSVAGKTVSDRAIRAWEKGEYQPELSIPQVKALCFALRISLEQLPDYLGPQHLNADLIALEELEE